MSFEVQLEVTLGYCLVVIAAMFVVELIRYSARQSRIRAIGANGRGEGTDTTDPQALEGLVTVGSTETTLFGAGESSNVYLKPSLGGHTALEKILYVTSIVTPMV